jgi:hypothetical protein
LASGDLRVSSESIPERVLNKENDKPFPAPNLRDGRFVLYSDLAQSAMDRDTKRQDGLFRLPF